MAAPITSSNNQSIASGLRVGRTTASAKRTQEEINMHLKTLTDPGAVDFEFTFPLIQPRQYQLKAWKDYHNGLKNFIISLPRRAGKDITSVSIAVDYALSNPNSSVVLMAPDKAWAKRIYWNQGQEILIEDPITGHPRKLSGTMLDLCCPMFLRKSTNKSESKIFLKNGSTIELLGSSEGTFVGMKINFLVVSETSRHNPNAFTLLSPVLLESGGITIYNGTVEDEINHFWKMIQNVKDMETWSVTYLTAEQTKQYYWQSEKDNIGDKEFNVNPELVNELHPDTGKKYDNIQLILDAGKSKAFLIREYLNFPSSVEEGSYYANMITHIKGSGKASKIMCYVPDMPVFVALDIGMSDMCSIVWFQMINDQIRFIDYYENNGKEIEHYINVIKSKPYKTLAAWAPHDSSKRSIQTGMNLIDYCRKEHNFQFNYLPKSPSIINDINVVRGYFHKMEFDLVACELMLAQLNRYHQGRNGKPEHDDSSHAADAFRYAIMCVHKGLVEAVIRMGYNQTEAGNSSNDMVCDNVDGEPHWRQQRLDSRFASNVDDWDEYGEYGVLGADEW